jgi:DNA processing protein
VLDHLTAASLSFLPTSLQRRLLDELRQTRSPRPDATWLRAALAAALRDDAAATALLDAARTEAEKALTRAAHIGIYGVTWGSDAYPPLLMQIADPPPLLWLRGAAEPLLGPCLAIVGSRAASDYGLEVATRLATDLASAGLVIVSGLARGADSAAHRGALSCGRYRVDATVSTATVSTAPTASTVSTGGRTVAVLGSGVDIIYPREHDRLALDIVARGGTLLSELPPGTPPRKSHFPRRNRLISGLSLGVLVIEASERSGSLQTARFAAEQGREVMAVPGSVLGERNRGAHALLRDGAALVERAGDVLNELRLPPSLSAVAAPDDPDDGRPAAGRAAAPVPTLVSMVEGEAYDFQALVTLTGLAAADLLRQLLLWELDGRVTRTADGRFLRAGRPVIR